MPTATTGPFLILFVIMWRLTKGDVLSIVLFFSIFQAASVLNFGALGVSPWVFVLLIGLVVKGFQRHAPFHFTPGFNKVAVRLMIGFICYAIVTGLIYPFIFQGVLVTGSHNTALAPLSWGVANVNQICYLLAAAVLYLMGLTSTHEELRSALNWYVRGCIVASCLAMYQLANATIHVPYPTTVLQSSPRYAIFSVYQIDGLWRLNSTFTEASAMAGFLSVGVALLGWDVLTEPLRWRSSLSLLLMLVSLLFTVSTTGYLALIFTLATGGTLYMGALFRQGGLSQAKAVVFLLAILVGTVGLVSTSAPATINRAIHSVILDKENTSSYKDRTATAAAAMETARQTYYLGAGWGSVRCSGLLYMLMGNVGLIGFLLFCAFLGSLCIPIFVGQQGGHHVLCEKSLFATAVMLAGMVVAGAELDSPILWALFAVTTAGSRLKPPMRVGRILSHASERLPSWSSATN